MSRWTDPRFDMQEAARARFPRTYAVLDEFTAEGRGKERIPGATFGVWRKTDPRAILTGAVGVRRLMPSVQPLSRHTRFDLASLTKVLVTAPLFARLVDRGWLDWEMPIQARLPEYPHRGIRMRHLLAHSSGLPAWAPYWERLLARAGGEASALAAIPYESRQAWLKEEVFATAPEAAPDTRTLYSDLSFLLLGWVIEATVGEALDRAVKKFLWEPMGLGDELSYRRITLPPGQNGDEEDAATETCAWRKITLQGEVHDDNAWSAGGVGGHAGAFGDVAAVVRFAAVLDRQRILSRSSLEKMWSVPALPGGGSRTLGWDLRSGAEPATGRFFSARTVGHLGFTGTSLWIDRDAGLAVALLTNRVHPSREPLAIRRLRPQFHDAIHEDLLHC